MNWRPYLKVGLFLGGAYFSNLLSSNYYYRKIFTDIKEKYKCKQDYYIDDLNFKKMYRYHHPLDCKKYLRIFHDQSYDFINIIYNTYTDIPGLYTLEEAHIKDRMKKLEKAKNLLQIIDNSYKIDSKKRLSRVKHHHISNGLLALIAYDPYDDFFDYDRYSIGKQSKHENYRIEHDKEKIELLKNELLI